MRQSARFYFKEFSTASNIHHYTKASAFQHESMYTFRYYICSCGKRNSSRVRLKQITTKQNTNNSAKYQRLHADCGQHFYFSVERQRTSKHKKSPLIFMYVHDSILNKESKRCQVQTYHVSGRTISLSGDVEKNPGPSDQCAKELVAFPSVDNVNSVSLLEARLSELGRTALDAGGGGTAFLDLSHQLYGNPNNHVYIILLGIQYLILNPQHFIESNTENSWQQYLINMSNEGTWADAIIIQAIANCLNLTVHIAESNANFVPVTVIHIVNMTSEGTNIYIQKIYKKKKTNIYIGHIDETHYVSTVEKVTNELVCIRKRDHNLATGNITTKSGIGELS